MIEQLRAALEKQAAREPNAVAITNLARTLSYSTLQSHVDSVSRQLNLLPDRLVGLYLDNNIEWCVADIALLFSIKTCIPLPLFFSKKQLVSILTKTKLNYLITDNQGIEIFKKYGFTILDTIPIACLSHVSIIRLENTGDALVDIPSETCKITFTSGTTGEPKGVCLSAKQFKRVLGSINQKLEPIDIYKQACLLPLTMLLENLAGLYRTLLTGGEYTIAPLGKGNQTITDGISAFSPTAFHEWCLAHQPHMTILMPHMVEVCHTFYQQPFLVPACLRFVAVGGGRLRKDILQDLLSCQFPVYEGYGLSECGSVVTLNTPNENKIGSVGKVLPHVKIEIAEDNEVIVHGNAMLGYLGETNTIKDKMNTGDLGRIDSEGFLSIVGRKKNTIITGMGRNISPEWLESEITRFPEISQALAVGSESQQNGLIIVSTANDKTITKIIERMNTELPNYARVRYWVRAVEPFTLDNHLLTYNGRLRREAIVTANEQQESQLILRESADDILPTIG